MPALLFYTVIPAHAGIHGMASTVGCNSWIPACAGMTQQRAEAVLGSAPNHDTLGGADLAGLEVDVVAPRGQIREACRAVEDAGGARGAFE